MFGIKVFNCAIHMVPGNRWHSKPMAICVPLVIFVWAALHVALDVGLAGLIVASILTTVYGADLQSQTLD